MRQLFLSGFFIVVTSVYAAGYERIEMTIDTSIYKDLLYSAAGISFYPHPEIQTGGVNLSLWMLYFAYLKKGSSVVDIFTYSGKVGSVTFPDTNLLNNSLVFSQTFLDDDPDWECLIRNGGKFQIIDSDGSTILSDSAYSAYLGFDGNSTYVINPPISGNTHSVAWRFRTGLNTSGSFPVLSKKSAAPLPMMIYGPSGNYNITLQPAGAGKTSVQLFDFLGRVVFRKTVDNITQPTTITIPGRQLPNTPFIAKGKSSGSETVKRELPVH